MDILSVLKRVGIFKEEAIADCPWNNRRGIYNFICSNLDAEGFYNEEKELPDANNDPDSIHWSQGAEDDLDKREITKEDEKALTELFQLLDIYAKRPDIAVKINIYYLLSDKRAVNLIDGILNGMDNQEFKNSKNILELARWMTFRAPDREIVKIGIIMIGALKDVKSLEDLVILGRHEEFAVFVAIALENMLPKEQAENEIYSIATFIFGWGRINLVKKLADTESDYIKEWMLREGYQNSIMHQYLAYICAMVGDLKGALSNFNIDRQMLNSCADIINALINGGPEEDMDDYIYAYEALNNYVTRVSRGMDTLYYFLTLHNILQYLSNPNWDSKARELNGFTDKNRRDLANRITALLDKNKWKEILSKELKAQYISEDYVWRLNYSAKVLGVDLWNFHLKRLKEKPFKILRWYEVMRIINSKRLDEVLRIAKENLCFSELCTGPEHCLGLGKEYEVYGILDIILQEIKLTPGKNEEFIIYGINSPVIRTRNNALETLEVWGPKYLSRKMQIELKNILGKEVEISIRNRIRAIFQAKRASVLSTEEING